MNCLEAERGAILRELEFYNREPVPNFMRYGVERVAQLNRRLAEIAGALDVANERRDSV